MSYNDLVIINNEKVFKEDNNIYCDNIDIKSIPEELNKNFNVTLIVRNSKIKRKLKINLNKAKISSNIFIFLLNIIKTFKNKKTTYLLVSITPYTFFAYLILFFSRKKVYVYLRSNGHEEYRSILGYFGPLIYDVMFRIVTFKSNIITCQERLFSREKCEIVFPSELDEFWSENIQKPVLDKPRLLYVGRMKVEKGIFSLLKIFSEIDSEIKLTIVGKKDNRYNDNNNVSFAGYGYGPSELIKIYDDHNISILPSFTEAHPKVIDESLSRFRPVIIFEEIEHVIQKKIGIFVSKRNKNSLLEIVDFIMKNYADIQKSMLKNNLPKKKEFISRLSSILNSS